VKKAEFHFNRRVTCGDLEWVLQKALPETTRFTADGVDVNWQQQKIPVHPGIVYVLYFDDDSFLRLADIGETNTKITWD
jgi:hypothetical protein